MDRRTRVPGAGGVGLGLIAASGGRSAAAAAAMHREGDPLVVV